MITITETEYQASGCGLSQADKILGELQANTETWVSTLALHNISGSLAVHSRIADLRGCGHRIEHRNEYIDGKCHSFYRFIPILRTETEVA